MIAYGHDFMELPDDFPDPNEVKTERFENTVWTPSTQNFNIPTISFIEEDAETVNVNALNPEDVHLERIDNKADERPLIKVKAREKDFVPVESRKFEIGERSGRFNKACIIISLDEIKNLNKALINYRDLLYQEISRLADEKTNTDLIVKRSKELKDLEDILPSISKFITTWKQKNTEPEIAYFEKPCYRGKSPVVLDSIEKEEKNVSETN